MMPSIEHIIPILTLAALLGSGLVAGIFFAFSTFIMKALDRVQPESGMRVMQEINVTVLTPWFLGTFLGTGVICLGLGVHALRNWESASPYQFLGSVVYLLGSILVTMVFNVPRNERLAELDPEQPEGVEYWKNYLVSWTRWNHVRTLASLAATALLARSLHAG